MRRAFSRMSGEVNCVLREFVTTEGTDITELSSGTPRARLSGHLPLFEV